jgi:hypothetical protein
VPPDANELQREEGYGLVRLGTFATSFMKVTISTAQSVRFKKKGLSSQRTIVAFGLFAQPGKEGFAAMRVSPSTSAGLQAQVAARWSLTFRAAVIVSTVHTLSRRNTSQTRGINSSERQPAVGDDGRVELTSFVPAIL